MRFLVLLLLAGSVARGEHWPQWRGPACNGSTSATGLPVAWSASNNVAWVAVLPGPGSSTPVVWGDRVFLTSVNTATREIVGLCVAVADGRVLWQTALGPDQAFAMGNNMASPSPITDGRHVWFYSGTGLLAAYRVTGEKVWQRALAEDCGPFALKFGYSSSPLLWQDKLYVPVLRNANAQRYNKQAPAGEPLDSILLALDPATGQTLWRHVRATDANPDESTEAYITPYPFTEGGRQDIVIAGGECVTGHDPATGAERWRWWFTPPDRKVWQRIVVTPVGGDGLLFVVRPKHRPVFALRIAGAGVLGDDALVWQHKEATPDVPSPLFYRGRLYLLDDTKKVLTALEPQTGRVIWAEKLPTTSGYYASPTGADGRIYCISRTGEVVVVAAADEFQLLATNHLGEGPCHSSVVAVAGRLFVRTGQNLYCITAP